MDVSNKGNWPQCRKTATTRKDVEVDGNKASPIKQAKPTDLMVAGNDRSLSQPTRKPLRDYISQYCYSLRNLVAATSSQSELLSPADLPDVAEQRLLSTEEMDDMHQHIHLQAEISINNNLYKLETLPEDTPLFYQFYCQDVESRIPDESIRIFNNNCAIEKSRPIIILINSLMINETVDLQIKQLALENNNVHIVNMSRLLEDSTVAGIKFIGGKTSEGQFYLTVDATKCSLQDHHFIDGKLRVYSEFGEVLDIHQFVAMYHCDRVCTLAGVETSSKGCIKIDWDMELIAPIGSLQCPNGFSAFVLDRISRLSGKKNELAHSLLVENSLMAVTRPNHQIMAESVCPHPGIYRNYSKVVSKSFNKLPSEPVYGARKVTVAGDEIDLLKMMCRVSTREHIGKGINPGQQLSLQFNKTTSWKQKIAFPLKVLKADQSRVWGVSSWQKNVLP